MPFHALRQRVQLLPELGGVTGAASPAMHLDSRQRPGTLRNAGGAVTRLVVQTAKAPPPAAASRGQEVFL